MGNSEYASSSFDILVGDDEYWSSDIDSRTAIVGGNSGNQVFYICRAYENSGSHPGRLHDGKCNYSFGGRGYASTNYEISNGDGAAAISLLDAATRGDASGIRAALNARQAINQKNDKGQTALMLAAAKGAGDAVRVLLNEGARVDARDNEGFTALMYAAYSGDPQSVGQLLRSGANLNSRTNDGNTPFFYAAAGGSIETVRIMMNDPAFEGLDSLGAGFPLHAAAANNHTRMIEFLLDSEEIDVDGQDENGQTAVMWAAVNNKSQAVGVLVRAGADLKTKNSNYYEVFGLAAVSDAADVLNVLLGSGSFKITDAIVEAALRTAARNNKLAALKFLLQRGADPDSQQEEIGNTALIWASAEEFDDAIKLLLNAKADPNGQNTRGETALMLAAANSKKSSLKLLLKAGANINLRDETGKTALQHAIDNNHKDTRKELEKAGAKL